MASHYAQNIQFSLCVTYKVLAYFVSDVSLALQLQVSPVWTDFSYPQLVWREITVSFPHFGHYLYGMINASGRCMRNQKDAYFFAPGLDYISCFLLSQVNLYCKNTAYVLALMAQLDLCFLIFFCFFLKLNHPDSKTGSIMIISMVRLQISCLSKLCSRNGLGFRSKYLC